MSKSTERLKLIPRDRSLVTGRKRLEHLLTYKHHPVFIGCTDEPPEKDLFADMSFLICKDSGIIQLGKLVPLNVLYSKYHSEALGSVWLAHHKEFVNFLTEFSPKAVLEIGGSNCFVAEEYLRKRRNARWTNVEPNPVYPKNSQIRVIPKFFNAAFKWAGKVDAVIHSHVLEHAYNPDEFLRNVRRFLDEGKLQIFSVPNLEKWLELGYTNCLNFEHSVFLTEYFVDYFLARNGFEVLKKHYFGNHSIFYATMKTKEKFSAQFTSKYSEYKKRFLAYTKKNQAIVAAINSKILKSKGPIYLFGAHIFSQSMINLGLRVDKIKSILDNSKIKHGKRLYGTNLLVQPPESIRKEKKPIIILRVGAYQDEIRRQLRSINKSAVFIE
jgi:SAM-dependent methyltransferase